MSSQMTDRQQNVYEMIRALIVKRGYGPTVREIGEHFGIKSPNGVMCHLRALERKGLIRRSPNKSRAIELVEGFDRLGQSLPLAGIVAAGPTTLAFEQSDRVDFSEMFFKDDRFILRVSGDSMIDAHIADGDYVVIQKQDTAEAGQMVVAQSHTQILVSRIGSYTTATRERRNGSDLRQGCSRHRHRSRSRASRRLGPNVRNSPPGKPFTGI
jgi:repressor LexA